LAIVALLQAPSRSFGQAVHPAAGPETRREAGSLAPFAKTLVGTWTYRSLINDPDLEKEFNQIRFGAGALRLETVDDGKLRGTLDFGGSSKLRLTGHVTFGNPPTLRFQGVGSTDDTKDWVYDYSGYLVLDWPHGVDQRPAMVGSIIRTAPHSEGKAKAGVVASWVAVRQDAPAKIAVAGLQPTRVRYDARSTQGKEMLKIYAGAVAKMKKMEEGDPRSWVFQWYTHWVDGKTNKADEIKRIYPHESEWSKLAGEMWETCQPHGEGMDADMFLPWHRMFLYYFEEIIREVSGDNSFTLPYWDYASADPARRGVLPAEFAMPEDPVFGALYVANRNKLANDLEPIHKDQLADPFLIGAFAQCLYSRSSPQTPGFCAALDRGVHGSVHVLVGTPTNMGAVPHAANDPIFWLHHSNIDRLWSSWNAAGRKNPPLKGSFVFADRHGKRVVAEAPDFLDNVKLNYVYDWLEKIPECPASETILVAAAAGAQRAAATRGPIKLGAEALRVDLEPVGDQGAKPVPLGIRVQGLGAKKRLYLVLKGLEAEAQPGVLYHVYLELPKADADKKEERRHVGIINFFDAVPHGKKADHAAKPKHMPERTYSFDVTDLAVRLQKMGRLPDDLAITIVPAGRPAAAARPIIAEASLVEQ
jgi:hypothetical protein